MTEDKVVHHNPTPPPIYCSVMIKHKGQVGGGQGAKNVLFNGPGLVEQPMFLFELSNEQTTFAEKTW